MEIWASVEPTVARLAAGDYRDQLAETGHDARPGDIDALADLGVQATRYPVLWEKSAPHDPRRIDLRWAHERLERLRARGVEPIVTLLHHGGGPRYTSLIEPAFPRRFAEYAGAVARAFPWVRRWTPINEPLTTARFATLYGHWHPGTRDDHGRFGAAVVNQIDGVRLAMQAIRAVRPDAELILTEDLQGFTAADPAARAYARHKQERSFLPADLLLGRVVPGHSLWTYLTQRCNVPAQRLRTLAADPLTPALLGWNYYPYSERYLSTRPDGTIANVGLIEVDPQQLAPRALFAAAHARFGLPLAFSEVHRAGGDAVRLRWLAERFEDALSLRARGVPIAAFGVWAVFGMIDWDSLLLRRAGRCEDGVFRFDAARDRRPQPTPLAAAVRALARGDYDAMRAVAASLAKVTSAEATT